MTEKKQFYGFWDVYLKCICKRSTTFLTYFLLASNIFIMTSKAVSDICASKALQLSLHCVTQNSKEKSQKMFSSVQTKQLFQVKKKSMKFFSKLFLYSFCSW